MYLSLSRRSFLHVALMICMATSIGSLFLILPVIPVIAQRFSISLSAAWQLATIFEVGKGVGLLAIAYLSCRYTPLTIMLTGTILYFGICLSVALFLTFDRTRTDFELGLLFVGVALLSMAAIVYCTMGLAAFKLTSRSTDELRWLVNAQGFVTVTLTGLAPFIAESVFESIHSISAPFWVMLLVPLIGLPAILMNKSIDEASAKKIATTPSPSATTPTNEDDSHKTERTRLIDRSQSVEGGTDVFKQGEQIASNSSTLSTNDPEWDAAIPDDLWPRYKMLLFEPHYGIHRRSLVLLGVATATQYTLPFIINIDLVEAGVSPIVAATMVAAVFGANIFIRVLTFAFSPSIYLLLSTSSWLMPLGSAMMLLGLCVFRNDTAIEGGMGWVVVTVFIPSVIMMLGVGASMPTSRAYAMMHVSDKISGTATTLLKFWQLTFVCFVQFTAAMLVSDKGVASIQVHAVLMLALHVYGAYLFTVHEKDFRA